MFSFASTTLILSLINIQARGVRIPHVVLGMALFVGGAAQFLAGMWEFACGNTFGATGKFRIPKFLPFLVAVISFVLFRLNQFSILPPNHTLPKCSSHLPSIFHPSHPMLFSLFPSCRPLRVRPEAVLVYNIVVHSRSPAFRRVPR